MKLLKHSNKTYVDQISLVRTYKNTVSDVIKISKALLTTMAYVIASAHIRTYVHMYVYVYSW